MNSRRVTLTFDNGPDAAVTPMVLDLLARYGVRATFFVLGSKASTAEGAALVARARAEGHWIGNHTYSHRTPLGLLPPDEAVRELNSTEQAIVAAGETRRIFRPYGGGGRIGKHLLQRSVVDLLIVRRYTCVLWNCVPGDWRDPEGWLERALLDIETRDWSLVVLHDIASGAMRHLERFLEELTSRGYQMRQEFPPECTPIVDGRILRPIDDLVSDGLTA